MGKSGPEYRNGEKGQQLQKRGKVRGFQDEDESDDGDKKIHRNKKDQRREAA